MAYFEPLPPSVVAGVRDAIIADLEAKCASRIWGGRAFGSVLARLRAGEPVVFSGWQLRHYTPGGAVPAASVAHDGQVVQYRLEPDDTVTPVVAMHDPVDAKTIVGYRPIL